MHPKRRSGRIAKELRILLMGTDTTGTVFSEATKTVVLSRHGAGILSKYRFAPDEVLSIRLPDTDKEAEIRLVGQIGGERGRYVYGVAFVDQDTPFWPMEFPLPETVQQVSERRTLECIACQNRQIVEQGEIEEDVYSVNGYILRYCDSCGMSTQWKKAVGERLPSPIAKSKQPAQTPASTANPLTASPQTAERGTAPAQANPVTPAPSYANSFAPSFDGPSAGLSDVVFESTEDSATASSGSAYIGTPVSDLVGTDSMVFSATSSPDFSSAPNIQASVPAARTAAAVVTPPAPAPSLDSNPKKVDIRTLDASGKPVNRRRHIRIRVNFTACVRQGELEEEIVECENVSKGGVCFHSRKSYQANSTIDIAAPFTKGEPALFVKAEIKRVESLAGGKIFRYGVEYARNN
jgi:hypothetical protein